MRIESTVFKEVFKGRSANNVSFLCAVLRSKALAIVEPSEKVQFLHVIAEDYTARRDALEKLKKK